MTNDELKAAWREQTPVVFRDATYTVSALIYRLPHELTAELYDKCGHAVVIATPDKIEMKGDDTVA